MNDREGNLIQDIVDASVLATMMEMSARGRSIKAKLSSNPSKAVKYAAAKKERRMRKAAQKARRRNLRAVATKRARDRKQAKGRRK